MTLRALFRRRNPARELARLGHEQRRRKVRAMTRLMREQLGLKPLPALEG